VSLRPGGRSRATDRPPQPGVFPPCCRGEHLPIRPKIGCSGPMSPQTVRGMPEHELMAWPETAILRYRWTRTAVGCLGGRDLCSFDASPRALGSISSLRATAFVWTAAGAPPEPVGVAANCRKRLQPEGLSDTLVFEVDERIFGAEGLSRVGLRPEKSRVRRW